jgi:hypothetical protein
VRRFDPAVQKPFTFTKTQGRSHADVVEGPLDFSVETRNIVALIGTRALAIRHLDAEVKNGAEGIVLARKYHVASWLRSGYTTLSRGAHGTMFLADAEIIGWETATKIYHIREEAAHNRKNGALPKCYNCGNTIDSGYCNYCGDYTDGLKVNVFDKADVDGVFAEEFRQADSDSAEYLEKNL